MSKRVPLLLVGALLLFVAPALADIVHLKDGGMVEGQILSNDGTTIRIKTLAGVLSIPDSKVASIEKKLTPEQEYEKKLAALDPHDAKGLYELGLFCKQQGWADKAKALFEKVLAIDPENPGANKELGNVEYQGKWMTPAARDALEKQQQDAKMRARGLVRYKGRWVTPEDKANLEKGLVKYHGKWMTPDDVKRAKGLVKYKGKWVPESNLEKRKLRDMYTGIMGIPVKVALSKHFAAIGPFSDKQLKALCDAGEKTWKQFASIFPLGKDDNLFQGEEKDQGQNRLQIVYSKRGLEYTKVVEAMHKRYPIDVDSDRANLMKAQSGFYLVYPGCYVVGHELPNTFQQVIGAVVHKTSHVMLMRYHYTAGFYPWWLIEGLGTYQEIALLGRSDTYCITDTGYANSNEAAKEKWAGSRKFKDIVKALVESGGAHSFVGLSKMGLNELTYRDIAKCWSLVQWMVAKKKKQLVALVDALKQKMKFYDAVQKAFGKPPAIVEKEWEDYVKANY